MPTFVLHGEGGSLHRRIDYTKELNQEQLDVVLHGDGPCLVLAGAGSGKTRTITYRVAYLLEQGVDPASILLMTFTNKAAREMVERVSRLLGVEASGMWGGTFHSIANRLLRVLAEHIGYTKAFTILDQEDSRSLIKAIMKDLKIDPKAQRFPAPAVVQDILSFSRNTLSSIEEALEVKHSNFQPLANEIEHVGRLYRERKQQTNSMDFDDLLLNWLALLEQPGIGDQLSARFKYILVDEYQDTNALQARLVNRLGSVHRNVLVVGDDAQSIYAFRGADVKNILSFPEQWSDAKIFKLLTNYRSVPEILEVANDCLSHNQGQFEKELVGVRAKGKKPLIVPTSSARQEAQYIAEQILALRSEGVALPHIAVLFRSSAHSQALEFELVKRDIPYEYRGGMKFFGRAHIKDMLAYLRVKQNPQDEAAWLRILSMQAGIGATTAGQLALMVRAAGDLHQVVRTDAVDFVPSRAREGWRGLMKTLDNLLTQGDEPSAMIRSLLESYRDYAEREYPDFRDRLEDLEQLILFAEGYRDLNSFLADISLYDETATSQESGGDGEERMVLSTIHQAKGLEWDTVFVIHLTDQGFPSRYATGESELEEERRLFYVAVTRARQRLFLTYPLTSGMDSLSFHHPSIFLEELSSRLTERLEIRDASSGTRWRQANSRDDEPFADDEEILLLDDDGEVKKANPSRSSFFGHI